MKDTVAIQNGIFRGLRSCMFFDAVNIVLGREFLVDSETKMDSLWQTYRTGADDKPTAAARVGLGIIVQIPGVRVPKPNSLQRQREFSVSVYEERNVNFTPNVGTMTTMEDWADLVLDFLWGWQLWRASGLIPEESAIVPDTRFKSIGIGGMTVKILLRQERGQIGRCATPLITIDGANNVTISVTDGSDIYYTTDGFSFPGPDNTGTLDEETAAVPYAQPFAVQSGQIIMAAAYPNAAANLPSQLAFLQAP